MNQRVISRRQLFSWLNRNHFQFTEVIVEEIMAERGHIFLEALMHNPVHGWENDDTELSLNRLM